MQFTFEPNLKAYYLRAISLLVGLIVLALLPLVIPHNGSAAGFTFLIALIATIFFGTLSYLHPRKLTLTITKEEVTVTDNWERVFYSRSSDAIAEVGVARPGHLLKFPLGQIYIREKKATKTKRFGSVSLLTLTEEDFKEIYSALPKARGQHTAEPDS